MNLAISFRTLGNGYDSGMDLTTGLLIGRIRGIAIRVHWSWIFIFTLLTWALATGLFAIQFEDWTMEQRWIGAMATAVLFFASVLLHELSHAFVALAYGMKVPSITLFIFGGVSSIAGEMETPGQEFRVAIAGPLMSAALGFFFMVLGIGLPIGDVGLIFAYLGLVNFILAIFNLLPGFPLDGGRVFRSIVWRRTRDLTRATQIASNVGAGIGWLLIIIGVLFVLTVGLIGIWWVLIGLFLKSAAESAYNQVLVEHSLRGLRTADVMRTAPEPMDEETDLERIVEQRVLRLGERVVFLARNDRVTGLITTKDLSKVPRERLAHTRAVDAMVPAAEVITVEPDTSLAAAVRLMAEKDVHQLPVLEGGQMVGLLSRGDVLQQIEHRMRFRDGLDPIERANVSGAQSTERDGER